MERALNAEQSPLVTVIITSYNYARFLRTSIGSVLDQDFRDLELIVIDNASTDETDAVVATFAHDPRLRYIKNPENIGLTPNHNRGLSFARGERVLFLSADDMLLPGHLRRCWDYLEAHPRTDVLYTGAMFMDVEGRPTSIRSMAGQLPVDYDGGRNEYAQQLCEGCYVPITSFLVRRSLYDELGPLDDAFVAADYEITVRWAAAGKRFAYLRIPSCGIRLHAPQASGVNYVASGRDLREYVAILERHVIPANHHLIRGYQPAIVGHLRWRASFYEQTGKAPLPPELSAQIDAIAQRIEAIPNGLPADDLGAAPLISVVVRPGSLPQLIRSLSSLTQQVDAPPWEAIVVGEAGPDYGAILATLPGHERFRFVRMDNVNAAEARHLGHRLAGGRIVTYLEPASYFEPGHLAALAAAFAGGAQVVRANGALLMADSYDGTVNQIFREVAINGIYRGDVDPDRDLVAPAIPIETVAHVRWALLTTGSFRNDLPFGDTWEFWLRLRRLPVATIPDTTVRVAVLRSTIVPNAPSFLSVANAIYAAYPAPIDSPLARRRTAYVEAMQRWFANAATIAQDQNAALNYLAEFHGIERAVVTT